MAAMITSGLMFFSRLICSICCRSWLAAIVLLLTVLLEFDFQPAVGDLVERDARDRVVFLLQAQADDPGLHRDDASRPMPPSLERLVAGEPRQAALVAPVVRLALEGPVEPRRGDLQGVG